MVINTWKAPLQIASALFLASALLSGGWAVRPAAAQETPPQAAALQRASAQREATYQEQLTQLTRTTNYGSKQNYSAMKRHSKARRLINTK